MQLDFLLSSDRSVCIHQNATKKRVLEKCSELLCQGQNDLDPQEVFEAFVARERLGCTGIGYGVALPHVRLPHLKQPVGALLHLKHQIDFGSEDKQPIDIVFALIVPEHQNDKHLLMLSYLAEFFNSAQNRAELRSACSSHDLYQSFFSAGSRSLAGISDV